MKAISLFSGMGGDSLGMAQVGLKLVAYSEKENVFRGTHDLNFTECALLGKGNIVDTPDSDFEMYKDEQIDLIFAGFPCFVAGTKVLTNSGYKNIEDVSLDMKLLTHTGKFQSILNLQRKVYNQKLYFITYKYHQMISCTEDHPFFIRNKKKVWNTSDHKYDIKFYPPEWKNAKDLTMDDYCGMVINKESIIPEFLSMTLDKHEQWFLMGYFVGDGWIEENKIKFAVNNTEKLLVLQKVLPLTYEKYKYECCDSTWFNILKQFGKYAQVKIIPEWVQNAPTEFIQEFINGYKACDGNSTSVSLILALGVQRLYLKLGHPVIEGILCNETSSFIEDEYVWYKPVNITTSDTESTSVYNFEVEIDNSYIVENLIVHNCQGFSNAGKKNVNDVRNTLFKEFLRATKLINPKYIIGENVKGLTTRKDKDGKNYIDVIINEFEAIGYTLKYQVMKSDKYGVPQKRERLIIIGKRNDMTNELKFPDEISGIPHLKDIVSFHMKGAIRIETDDFDMSTIPSSCILTDMSNNETENQVHPYLRLKAKTRNTVYTGKTYVNMLSFAKRDSPIHCEIIDIRKPCKTIICTYEHQPRLFVPLKNQNGYYLRPLLVDELKQIQGFPIDYLMNGTEKQKIIQIGNAVPPPLIKLVAKSLLGL